MTPVLSREAFAELGAPSLVYVREIKGSEVLADTPVEVIRGFDIDPDDTLYALHGADGARLAVLSDRDSAYAAAIAHELIPVAVH